MAKDLRIARVENVEDTAHLEALRRLEHIAAYTANVQTDAARDLNAMARLGHWATPRHESKDMGGGAFYKLFLRFCK